jgi:TPR repeat protein
LKKKLSLIVLFCSFLLANSYDNGIAFYKKGLYKKAMDSFIISSNGQNNQAMFAIGVMYANGDGVKKDKNKSKYWFKKSALNGNINACNKLGNIYALKKDYKKSFKWFEKSAKKGDSQASYNLGYFYTGGLGVKMDLKKSLYWYEKSSIAGNIDAQLNLGFMYIAGHGTKVDYKKASFWIKKAKDTGSQKAKLLWDEFKLKKYGNNND